MSLTFDEIAQKRLEDSQNKGIEQTREAIVNGAKSTDIQSLFGPLQDLRRVVKAQPDVRPDIKQLNEALLGGLRKLDSSELSAKQINLLHELISSIKDQQRSAEQSSKELREALNEVLKAVNAIEVAPVVNVPAPVVNVPKPTINLPAPKVTVEAPKLDLKPMEKAIQGIKIPEPPEPVVEPPEEPKIDLDDYKAQDIDNSSKNTQYIGFLNPAGDWYIIENDIKGDKLRYVFGSGGYSKAFSNAASYEYKLLDEAVNAV